MFRKVFKFLLIMKCMETQKYAANYEVFGANMTVDTKASVYSAGYISACKSCQCHCHLCRGNRMPTETGALSNKEIENALEKLLVAQN